MFRFLLTENDMNCLKGVQDYDRSTKASQYAALGVRNYWLVDPELQQLRCYRADAGKYVLVAEGQGTATLSHPDWPDLNISARGSLEITPCYGIIVDQDATKLLQDALKLPPEARAALAGSLLDSLDISVDEDAETAWELEIARRIQDLDASKSRPIPWVEAHRRIAGR
jgi:putative addiction module component (TIGR02574 family)